MKFQTLILALGVLMTGCSHAPTKAAPANPEDAKLTAIVNEYSTGVKYADPFAAAYFNVEENLGKFGDFGTPAYIDRWKNLVRVAVEKLKTIDPAKLSSKERKSYQLFSEDMEVSMRGFRFPSELVEFSQMGNRLHSYLDESSQNLTDFPFDSVKHYEDFVHRSEGFPTYVDHQIELLRRGVREGYVLSCVIAESAVGSYKDGLEPVPEKNPFYRPISFMPKTFPKADQDRLAGEFRSMVTDRIVPGYKKFDEFFRKEYTPKCRKTFGFGALPHGKEWYDYAIESTTNLKLSAKELHATGESEVARISKEMTKVKDELGYQGSLHAFQASLLHDPRFFFKSAKEMFSAFEKVKAEIEGKVPTYFHLIPKADYKIVESSNPADAGGSYQGPTENVPYGRFVVNTNNLHVVPLYEVTTLSLHETIPGHHFQIALQWEMGDQLSEYRRKMYFSGSFVEGWALYAEYLGNEMGMYQDPMQRLGHLNDEMLRAVRLVVDTGIHAMGWSRQKAYDYMKAHLATSEKDIGIEVNRYSVWPGQALSYKVGQLKILELRHFAEKELGPKFDIKGFHQAVIGEGTVSLGVLDSQVKEWVASVKALQK